MFICILTLFTEKSYGYFGPSQRYCNHVEQNNLKCLLIISIILAPCPFFIQETILGQMCTFLLLYNQPRFVTNLTLLCNKSK